MLITVVYLIMLMRWFIVWKLNGKETGQNFCGLTTKVSVIVATRNEETNILNCLNFLVQQNYPADLLEIIISDDHSTDETRKLCSGFIHSHQKTSHQIQLISANVNDATGKKEGLIRAVNVAQGELILTTDADCSMNNNWVSSFAYLFEKRKSKLITGFVAVKPVSNFFTGLQALDFLSLSLTSAISVIREKPLMCNGANLAFSKSAFVSLQENSYGSNDPSGDDTYLMLKIAESNPGNVIFNNNVAGIVFTKPQNTLSQLLSQRIRWSSKIRKYKEGYIKRTGIILFIVNLILIIALLFSALNFITCTFALSVWCIKMIADLIILYPASVFAGQRNLLLLFLPAQLLYPFYAIAGTILSVGKVGYKWKERSYK